MSTKFNAPQTPLRSSWKQEVFKAPVTRGVIITQSSKYGRPNTTIKFNGEVLLKSRFADTY